MIATVTLSLCCLAAVLEGFGLQSVGVAAGRMAAEFHFSAAAMGWIASASTIGLLPGAVAGGWAADRVGRKRVLAGAVGIFGIFNLAATAAVGLKTLLLLRLLAGLGLGATLPNLIALSAEAAERHTRSRFIGLMYCGVPAGGALVSLLSILGGAAENWRVIFYVGGALAVLAAFALLTALPESAQFQRRRRAAAASGVPSAQVLFGDARAPATLLLWAALFFQMLVIYVLLNWLPVLLVRRGFSPLQAGAIQLIFNLGGVGGNLLFGRLMDRASRRTTAIVMYGCVIGSLAALAALEGFWASALAGFAVGLFAIGGQMVPYALVPIHYPTLMRSTGVGWSVAIGRLGSFAGPVLAGEVLQAGVPASVILAAATPGLVVAAVAALLVLGRPEAVD